MAWRLNICNTTFMTSRTDRNRVILGSHRTITQSNRTCSTSKGMVTDYSGIIALRFRAVAQSS